MTIELIPTTSNSPPDHPHPDVVVRDGDGGTKLYVSRYTELVERSPEHPYWQVILVVCVSQTGDKVYLPAHRVKGDRRWRYHPELASADRLTAHRAAQAEVVPVARGRWEARAARRRT